MDPIDRKRQARAGQRRQQVATEAARLMAQHGLQDMQQAKLKAARQLGIEDEASLPRNAEVQEKLREYQRLFRGDAQPAQLRRRRAAALEAMEFLAPFQPRLVGPVLDGTADENSPVCLHVFSDEPEAVARFLFEAAIPAEASERRLRLTREQAAAFPAWQFEADGLRFEVVALPERLLRNPPLADRDGAALARASLSAVRALLSD